MSMSRSRPELQAERFRQLLLAYRDHHTDPAFDNNLFIYEIDQALDPDEEDFEAWAKDPTAW